MRLGFIKRRIYNSVKKNKRKINIILGWVCWLKGFKKGLGIFGVKNRAVLIAVVTCDCGFFFG